MVLLYLLVVFVNSLIASVSEQIAYTAPDDFSPRDFFLLYKCCCYEMQSKHWAGTRNIYILGQKAEKHGASTKAIIDLHVFK